MTHMHQADDTEILLANSVQSFLAHEHSFDRLRQPYYGKPAYDRRLWRLLAQQGWLSVLLPESNGGSELSTRHAAAIALELGRRVVPEPFVACGMMPAVLAGALATDVPAWQTVIDGLLDGERITTVVWQEQPLTLDVTATTAATTAGDHVVLQGVKHGIVAASLADQWLVSATFEGEPSLWLLPRDSEGITLHEQLTSDGGTLGVANLNNVCLPSSALLARGAAVSSALEAALQEALLLTCAQLNGMAQQALKLTLDYLRTRVQFGQLIGSFQSLQHMAVDVRIQQALALAAFQAALSCHAHSPASNGTLAAISAAKARVSDAALQAGRFGVQAHGAIGFAAEADIGLYLKSALRLAAWLGNGTYHRQRFGELKPA